MVGGPKVIIVSARVLLVGGRVGGRVYTGICRLQAWKSFPVGGGGWWWSTK